MNYEGWLKTVPEEITGDSFSANLAEGYSRGTGRDRARFYEYALGSARESRDCYYKAQYVLGETVIQHRLQFLTQIIRLLLTMIPQQRGRTLREPDVPYQAIPDHTKPETNTHGQIPDDDLQNIPFA